MNCKLIWVSKLVRHVTSIRWIEMVYSFVDFKRRTKVSFNAGCFSSKLIKLSSVRNFKELWLCFIAILYFHEYTVNREKSKKKITYWIFSFKICIMVLYVVYLIISLMILWFITTFVDNHFILYNFNFYKSMMYFNQTWEECVNYFVIYLFETRYARIIIVESKVITSNNVRWIR